jgi:hypothetical protein
MLARFQEQDGYRRIDACNEVQQDRALGAEARDHGRIAQHIFAQQDGQHLNRIAAPEHIIQADSIAVCITRGGVDTICDADLISHAVASK